MFRHYYRIAIRHILRGGLYSFLNILCLSLGILIALLIGGYCWSEWRVNRDFTHADRQYILMSDWKDPNLGYPLATLGPLALALKENYPGLVANYYRQDGVTSAVSYGDKHFREGLQIGDSTMLTMYGFRLLYGNARTALDHPFTVVITADRALKYFGRTDVVGKDLTIESFSGGKKDFRITGVMADPPRNSVTRLADGFPNHVFVGASNLPFFGRNMDWQNLFIAGFVELREGVTPESLAPAIDHLVKSNASPFIYSNLRVRVVPLTRFYLSGGIVRMFYTLVAIGVLILLMAMVNFVNLSIGQSASRLREIGVRKVLGSLRRQVTVQFLAESVLLSLIATVFALIGYAVFSPAVSGILGKSLPALTRLPVPAWPAIVLFALACGWLAGVYPAHRLSAIGSVEVLKGRPAVGDRHGYLRKGLVAFQLCIAAIAMIGAIIVAGQIRLFFSDSLGYDKEAVVAAQLPRDWTKTGVQKMESLRARMVMVPGVRQVSLSYEIPNGMNGGNLGMYKEGGDSTRAVTGQALVTDEHYADTYGLRMAAGSYFHSPGESAAADSFKVVINETAVRSLGWKQPGEAVGRRIRLFRNPNAYTVAGVVRDFHFDAMNQGIQPELFLPVSSFITYRYFSFKLAPGNPGRTMAALRKEWSSLMPGAAFEYKFMDEYLQDVYVNELRLKKAASAATVLAMIIVLLGVVGLLSQSVQKRTKEIAIRKVIGASVPGIIRLFLREYLPLLLVAGLVATPVAWWVMDRWLSDYATRIEITVWPFVMTMVGLGVVMVLLIVARTLGAALANPVKSLKSE
ncbi:MAG: ABC transporter permease [Bacteroidetes bacterium]|nr:ABC transporter permease [Bacteroidota bacterium]